VSAHGQAGRRVFETFPDLEDLRNYTKRTRKIIHYKGNEDDGNIVLQHLTLGIVKQEPVKLSVLHCASKYDDFAYFDL
jgi:hypothetical protein